MPGVWSVYQTPLCHLLPFPSGLMARITHLATLEVIMMINIWALFCNHKNFSFPLYKRGNQGTAWLSVFPEATQLLNNRAEIETHVVGFYPCTTSPFAARALGFKGKGPFYRAPPPAVPLPHLT